MILILIAVVAFFFLGGKNLLFGGDDSANINLTSDITAPQTQTQNSGSGIMNLLSTFMGGASGNPSYDFSGMLSGLTGGGLPGTAGTSGQNGTAGTSSGSGYQQYFTTTLENNDQEADAREG